jgi:hypothetical protein
MAWTLKSTMVGPAFSDMVTCGSRSVTKKNRMGKNIAYLVINISPCFFPGAKNPPFPENREEGEHKLYNMI